MTKRPEYELTNHAQEEATLRGIDLSVIDNVINNPTQILDSYSERKIYQSKVEMNEKEYIVWVIVEIQNPLKVVTVYRTSNIKKYWKED